MELKRTFLISLSFEKNLSAVATVTGSLLLDALCMPYKRQDKMLQTIHFLQSKKAIS